MELSMTKLIDVSHHNGAIDWAKVASDPQKIGGVIIRAGYGRVSSQRDKCFEKNYCGAKKAGLPVGAYWYSYATTTTDARAEAKACMRVIAGKTFDYPVYFDIEDKCHLPLSKAVCSDIVRAFCDCLEEHRYFAGVYSFDSFFGSNLESGIPARYTAWAARVERVKPKYCKPCAAWQYSWKGKVNGIDGDVDLNEFYKDFPGVIRKAGLNGC
jgi:GH25 family lysozyme M1 (1,4-beta-N-acetylmuramidase)